LESAGRVHVADHGGVATGGAAEAAGRRQAMTHSGGETTLRTMRPEDIPFAMEVKTAAGWNQTARDWAAYLGYAPDGCFVAERAGRRVGTATTIAYGRRCGWVGMVLVHPEARRGGIGTALLRRAIAALQARGVAAVKLDATPMGRTVYLPMGFRDEYELTRFEGAAPAGAAPTGVAVQFMTERDLPELTAFDAEAFGAERGAVLRSMASRNPEFCFVRREAGRIAGYLIARHGANAVQIGPWVARDAGSAEELLRAFWRRVPGRRVFVDVPHPNAAGLALIRGAGFAVQRGYTRMFLGENPFPGLPERVFGTSSAEKG
jgi:ribosomal protein S18 acetylase RimI-like enzyme